MAEPVKSAWDSGAGGSAIDAASTNTWTTMKFGGSSLADINNLKKVCEIIVSTQASYQNKDSERKVDGSPD